MQAKSPVPISPEEAKAFYEGGIKDLNIIDFSSYILGSELGKSGVAKLKSHVDLKNQSSISEGLGRVGNTALFVSLPLVLDLMKDAQIKDKKTGKNQATYEKLEPLQ